MVGYYKQLGSIKGQKIAVLCSATINLSLLFVFKYADFFISLVDHVPSINIAPLNLALPIGISFYTFQTLSLIHIFAMKAFYPEKPPFPFLHVDTTWKFKEMIEFRDRMAKKLGIDLIAVSYTHLDVYKRQGRKSASYQKCTR